MGIDLQKLKSARGEPAAASGVALALDDLEKGHAEDQSLEARQRELERQRQRQREREQQKLEHLHAEKLRQRERQRRKEDEQLEILRKAKPALEIQSIS